MKSAQLDSECIPRYYTGLTSISFKSRLPLVWCLVVFVGQVRGGQARHQPRLSDRAGLGIRHVPAIDLACCMTTQIHRNNLNHHLQV